MKWDDLIKQGVIEHLDTAEEENALVAFSEGDLTEEHTHLEVSQEAIISLIESTFV